MRRRVGNANLWERAWRLLWPIPTSPSPKTDSERYALKLVPVSALTKRLEAILRFLASTSSNPLGDYAEFGVYNGTSMGCMFDALSNLRLSKVRLFGFDSFRGLPPDVTSEDDGVWKPGQFACPKEIAMERLISKGVPPERVSLIEGWYKETLLRPPTAYGINQISVAFIDCDTYSSARLALQFVYPVLTEISALIFDDWKLNDLDIKRLGEFRAMNEFLDSHPELILQPQRGYNRKSKIFIATKRIL